MKAFLLFTLLLGGLAHAEDFCDEPQALFKQIHFTNKDGRVAVQDVMPDTIFAKQGIVAGDIWLELNEVKIATPMDLAKAAAHSRDGNYRFKFLHEAQIKKVIIICAKKAK